MNIYIYINIYIYTHVYVYIIWRVCIYICCVLNIDMKYIDRYLNR